MRLGIVHPIPIVASTAQPWASNSPPRSAVLGRRWRRMNDAARYRTSHSQRCIHRATMGVEFPPRSAVLGRRWRRRSQPRVAPATLGTRTVKKTHAEACHTCAANLARLQRAGGGLAVGHPAAAPGYVKCGPWPQVQHLPTPSAIHRTAAIAHFRRRRWRRRSQPRVAPATLGCAP